MSRWAAARAPAAAGRAAAGRAAAGRGRGWGRRWAQTGARRGRSRRRPRGLPTDRGGRRREVRDRSIGGARRHATVDSAPAVAEHQVLTGKHLEPRVRADLCRTAGSRDRRPVHRLPVDHPQSTLLEPHDGVGLRRAALGIVDHHEVDGAELRGGGRGAAHHGGAGHREPPTVVTHERDRQRAGPRSAWPLHRDVVVDGGQGRRGWHGRSSRLRDE